MGAEKRVTTPFALTAESNRPSQALDLYRLSPESGDSWYTSRHMEKTICSLVGEDLVAAAAAVVGRREEREHPVQVQEHNLKGFKDVYLEAKARIWP